MSNPKGNHNPSKKAAAGRNNNAAGRGRGGHRGRGGRTRGGQGDQVDRGIPQHFDHDGRGGFVINGRGGYRVRSRVIVDGVPFTTYTLDPIEDDDVDYYNYDDDCDDTDDDESDDSDEEQLLQVPVHDVVDYAVLAKHKAVMRRVVSDPASLAANNASELIETLSFLENNIRAPNALEWFLSKEGFATLLALTGAVTGSAPLSGLDMTIDLSDYVLSVLVGLSLSRQSLDAFVKYNLLPELSKLFSKKFSNKNKQAKFLKSEIMDQVLAVLENNMETSKKIANTIDGNMKKLDAFAVNLRKLMLKFGFVEWAVANLNSLCALSANRVMSILFDMVDKQSESKDESFNPKARFLRAGGVAALDKSLKDDMVAMNADDGRFNALHSMLALRLASGMMLDHAEMANAFGKTEILVAVDAILSKVRMDHVYISEPMDHHTEQLVICTVEFVSTFIDLLPNCDAVLETQIINNMFGVLEHVANDGTNPYFTIEFRFVALKVLVAGFKVEATQSHSKCTFTRYLSEHASAVDTLSKILKRGIDFDEDDSYDDHHRLIQEDISAITAILARFKLV